MIATWFAPLVTHGGPPKHAPAAQTPVGKTHAFLFPQAVPHAAGRLRLVSHPLFPPVQSPNPALQLLIPQTPAVHDAVPFAVEHVNLFAQVVPHVAVELRFVSQSVAFTSQFAMPAPHPTQAPAVHVCVPARHVSTVVVVTRSAPH